MSDVKEEWLRRTAWKRRAEHQVASRNGAVAIWVGVSILLGLFYSAVISLILNLAN